MEQKEVEEKKQEILHKIDAAAVRHRVTGLDLVIAVACSALEAYPRLKSQRPYLKFVTRQLVMNKELEKFHTELESLDKQQGG